MTYLYGDSTPSQLKTNFLEFLRDALDFSVHLVQASVRLEEEAERADAHRQAAEVEISRIDALEAMVLRALAGAAVGAAESPTARCRDAIAQSASELAHAERESVRSKLAREVGKTETEAAQQRTGCFRALESLAKKHELPQSTAALALRREGEGYNVVLRSGTPYGLTLAMELEVPAGHALAAPLRVDRVVERLEVQAPELSGWIQKTVKLKAQRVEKYYLSELALRPGETVIKLRSSASGEGDGFDFTVVGPPVGVTLLRTDAEAAPVDEARELAEPDVARVVEFRDKLVALAMELAPQRKALLEADFEGAPVAQLPEPTRVVERLMAAIAPTVHEIAQHSLSPNELVLKRLVSGDRREECFVSKAELRARVDRVPETLRTLFDPLGLSPPSESAPLRRTTMRTSNPGPERTVPPREEPSSPSLSIEELPVVEPSSPALPLTEKKPPAASSTRARPAGEDDEALITLTEGATELSDDSAPDAEVITVTDGAASDPDDDDDAVLLSLSDAVLVKDPVEGEQGAGGGTGPAKGA